MVDTNEFAIRLPWILFAHELIIESFKFVNSLLLEGIVFLFLDGFRDGIKDTRMEIFGLGFLVLKRLMARSF